MVQADEARRIRAQWEQAGRPTCRHEEIQQETHAGGPTGDTVCMGCGEIDPDLP